MSKPNVHGLPQHLRKDGMGYFLDYFVKEGGLRKRKRIRLGQIPAAQAKRVLAQHMQAVVEQRYIAPDKPQTTFLEAAESFLAYSKARKRTYRNDVQMVERLKAYFGKRPLESLTIDQVDRTSDGIPVLVSREHHVADAFDFTVLRRGPGEGGE